MKVTSKIIEIDSGKPGPSLGIVAGVHGNELAGVYALQQLLPELKPAKGRLYIAFGNPKAIEANVRMLDKNLNRCFVAGNSVDSYEDMRAQELMKMFDKCDALLDLHMFYDNDGEPFVICEENAFDLAKKFDVKIISNNWSNVEPGGTDDYMFKSGKIGICIECGPISKAKEYTEFAIKTIYQFLRYFEMSPVEVGYSTKTKRLVTAKEAVYKTSNQFNLKPGFKNFQALNASEEIANEGNKSFIAKENDCIIFPHYNARVDEEAYIIGQENL